MGDNIAFLSKKTFDGKTRTDEGTLSATGDLATLTANSGKDMYLAKAKVSAYINASAPSTSGSLGLAKVVLKVNAVIKETFDINLAFDNSPVFSPGNANYEFAVEGLKVSTAQIIKLEVTVISADIDIRGVIEVFEEDTGATPAN